jgi:predicted benzoate:H+ symporter BenE
MTPDRQERYAAALVIAAGMLIWGSLAYAVLKIAGG